MHAYDTAFLGALREGRQAALSAFYERLVSAKDDAAFWREISAIMPNRTDAETLRRGLDGGGFDRFVKHSKPWVLALFLTAAMGVSGCASEDSGPATVPVTPPAADVSDGTTAADGTVAPEAPIVTIPTPPTAEALQKNLRDYIRRAQLPAAEKRRMLSALGRVSPAKLVDAEAELSALFLKSDPQEIADALEALVLLKRTEKGWLPAMGRLYKGADFA